MSLRTSLAIAFTCLAACESAPPEPAAVSSAPAEAAPDETGCLGPGCSGGLEDGEFEFVIVGAGAGGGPLAARLAERGHRVLLLEAGGDPGDRLTYQIPAWHGLASEDPAMRWDYFVDHYDDAAEAARDDKLVRDASGAPVGVWYPRGSGIGGSTAMNAMIAVTPHASDWDRIADLTRDEDPSGSWRAAKMNRYFERATSGGGAGSGWMQSETHLDDLTDYLTSAVDLKMLRVIAATILQNGRDGGADAAFDPLRDLSSLLGYVGSDLNSSDPGRDRREGVFRLPQQSRGGRRAGVREFILDTIAAGHPLTVKLRALATNVTFDRAGPAPRATGVEWVDGPNLYSASPRSGDARRATAHAIRVTGEVILSAGAFNTPQLLMLSGIGPRAELERHGVETILNRPGVGANLQDRYEVGVVGEMTSLFGDEFRLLKDCSFDPSAPPRRLEATNPCYVLWQHGAGVYTINGAVVGVVKRSDSALADPDLFIFGIPGHFGGYWPGYSEKAVRERSHFTWVVLKAHTNGTRGTVTLRSADPRDRPEVDFRYFSGGAEGEADLRALVEGVLFARGIVERTRALSPFSDDFREVYPGPELESRDEIARFIRDKAWGHHACCTAKIGRRDDPLAVLDGRFRVRGVERLRVVDASVFPKIPGFFIAVPIYMASEKAADVIHEDAGRP